MRWYLEYYLNVSVRRPTIPTNERYLVGEPNEGADSGNLCGAGPFICNVTKAMVLGIIVFLFGKSG